MSDIFIKISQAFPHKWNLKKQQIGQKPHPSCLQMVLQLIEALMGSPAAANRRSRTKQNEKNIYRRGSTEKKRTDETSRHWDSACKKGPGAQNFLLGRRYTSWKWLQASCKFTILNRPRNDAIRAKRLGELGSTCALPKLAACLLYTTNFTTKPIETDSCADILPCFCLYIFYELFWNQILTPI